MMRKHRLPLIAATLCALTLSACGEASKAQMSASSSSAAYNTAAEMSYDNALSTESFSYSTALTAEDAEMETPSPEETGAADAETAVSQRKLVYRSYMELEAESFEEALNALLEIIENAGGYVENQEIIGTSLSARYADMRYASIEARIPADGLQDVTGAVEDVCNVLSQSERIEDITDTYFDADARLSSLQLQEERLLDILSKAESLEDVITLESALSEVRYEIESLTASLRRMDSQVAYSYLHLSLNEVQKYTAVNEAPRTFGQRLAESFRISGEKVVELSERFLLGAIENLPVFLLGLLFWGVILFIVFRFVRFLLRRFGGMQKLRRPYVPANQSSSAYRPAEARENVPKKEENDPHQSP